MKSVPFEVHAVVAPPRVTRWLHAAMLVVAAVFFAMHFLHLNADFPNNSPWTDWSKYTDEGWYGDAAIRHYLFGHWYFPGDFNPAVALPMWPLVELIVFRFTGVSPAAARALTVCVFGATLVVVYVLVRRFERMSGVAKSPSLAAPLAVLLLCASPFFFVFERMAILEPLLILLTLLALLVSSRMHAVHFRALGWREALPSIGLGLLLPAMVLTKTTAAFLMPAIAYMMWARAGHRVRATLRMAIIPVILAAAIWLAYLGLFVRPHYLEDYRYLFSANAYTGIMLEPPAKVILTTIVDGAWMGQVLYPVFFGALALTIFWRPQLFRNPLVPALLLWICGYVAFLAYHNNLQPRYYMVVAAPITVFVAIALDAFRQTEARAAKIAGGLVVTAVVLGILVPDGMLQAQFVANPEYTFRDAANGVKRVVEADQEHSRLILSISGSDITLFTGLPSIDDDFGTLDLDERVKAYRPGWYVAWNELDDDKMDALTEVDRVTRVAAFPAMDDPERNLLILYRLDPKQETPKVLKAKKALPKALQTKLGQQPDATQLQH